MSNYTRDARKTGSSAIVSRFHLRESPDTDSVKGAWLTTVRGQPTQVSYPAIKLIIWDVTNVYFLSDCVHFLALGIFFFFFFFFEGLYF